MKTIVSKFAVTAFALLFGMNLVGCEGAPMPMGESNELAADVRLEGYWQSVDEDKEEANVRIWVFNEHEYYLEWELDEEDDGPKFMRLRAFASEVDGMLMANIVCVGCDDDEPEWFFFRYELESPDVLIMQSVRDKHYRDGMSKMASTREIRDYVEAHINDADFFEDEIARFQRMEMPEED
jgi:hypothetical protein